MHRGEDERSSYLQVMFSKFLSTLLFSLPSLECCY